MFVVNAAIGEVRTYVDGEPNSVLTGIEAADLRLQHKLMVLGGGKQAQARGGDVRNMALYSKPLDNVQVGRMRHLAHLLVLVLTFLSYRCTSSLLSARTRRILSSV
jgi:hypothetical protein